MPAWPRAKKLLVERIFGLNDTPHRIAWGVSLGFVVAFSPTVGLQMLLYVGIATLLRANKVSGLPVVWITNPFTLIPVYYSCWRVGAFVLGKSQNPNRGAEIVAALTGAEEQFDWSRLLLPEFWSEFGATLWALGGELWIGGLVVGGVSGLIAYPLTIAGVRQFRRFRQQ